MTAEAVDEKVAIVAETGAPPAVSDAIEMNIRAFMVIVTEDVDTALDTLAEFTGAPVDVIAASPFALVGPPEQDRSTTSRPAASAGASAT